MLMVKVQHYYHWIIVSTLQPHASIYQHRNPSFPAVIESMNERMHPFGGARQEMLVDWVVV